ncbi:hypothetical protein TgHK011_009261 [Trichoderma gracile]|nr:hypothetical protein TgHK011_009261 [Trichoderma gracile]
MGQQGYYRTDGMMPSRLGIAASGTAAFDPSRWLLMLLLLLLLLFAAGQSATSSVHAHFHGLRFPVQHQMRPLCQRNFDLRDIHSWALLRVMCIVRIGACWDKILSPRGLISHNSGMHRYVVLRTAADPLAPDSEPASGNFDRGGEGCSEAVRTVAAENIVNMIMSCWIRFQRRQGPGQCCYPAWGFNSFSSMIRTPATG